MEYDWLNPNLSGSIDPNGVPNPSTNPIQPGVLVRPNTSSAPGLYQVGVSQQTTPLQRLQSAAAVPQSADNYIPSSDPEPEQRHQKRRLMMWLAVGTIVLALIGAGLIGLLNSGTSAPLAKSTPKDYLVTSVPLSDLVKSGQVSLAAGQQLSINGQVNINNGFVLTPSQQPTTGIAGQIYYNKDTNILAYFNGSQFVDLSGSSAAVSNIAGLSGAVSLGAGLGAAGDTLVNTGVLSLQGQTGNVVLTSGGGINVSGLNITNTGITAVAGGNGLTVSAATGSVTLSLPQNLTTAASPSFAGLQLAAPLSLASGGTGGTSFATNGVLYGNGAGSILATAGGTAGQCLIVGGSGVPTFGSCTGATVVTSLNGLVNTLTIAAGAGINVTDNGSNTITIASSAGVGVSSLDGLTGALTIANTSGSGATITINDASTSAKGIAQFNATNFSVAAGVVNTVQGIAVTSAPTFAGLTLTSPLSVVSGGTGANTFAANGLLYGNGLGALLATAAGSTGHCLIAGVGGVPGFQACPVGGNISSGTSQTPGRITKFDTTTNQITDSILTEATGTVTASGNFTVTGTPTLSALGAGVLHSSAGGVVTSSAVNLNSGDVANTLQIGNGGTGATTPNGARTNLGAAASGANSDITSLSGLTTALSAGQGGTGQNTYTDGQLLIGNTAGNTLTKATLTAGSGVTIVNGNGSITISAPNAGSCGTCANVTLSNLSSPTAINQSLLTNGTATIDLGSTTNAFRDLYLSSQISILESGATPTFRGSLAVADLSANQTYTLNEGGTVVTGGNVGSYAVTAVTAGSGLTGGGGPGPINLNVGAGTGVQINADSIEVLYGAIAGNAVQGNTQITVTAGTNLSGGGIITLGSGGSVTVNTVNNPIFTTSVTTPLLNLTNSGFTGALQPTTLTASQTYTLPNQSGTVCLSTGNCPSGGNISSGTSQTAGRLVKFDATTNQITDSVASEAAGKITIGGTLDVTGASTVTLGSGSSNTGSLLFKNSSNNNTLTLQSGATGSNLTFTLPTADGTNAQCLKTNASGVLSFGDCLTGASGGSGGVTSLNSLSGTLNLANASGSGSTITIDNASTSAKGIAQFNATNFTASSGTINTIQDIATTSSPTFASTTFNSNLRVLEDGGSPSFYGTLNVADLAADQTYTFNEGGNVVTSGNVGSNAVTSVTAANGLTGGGGPGSISLTVGQGTGIQVNADDIAVVYGAIAGSAVQGNTQITVTAGTNLSGGGSITLGSGGSVTVNTVNNPTFSTSVSTPMLVLSGAGSNGTIQVANLGQATAYTLPDPGAATATICLSTGNCAGAGGGITGSGTAGTIAKFTGSGASATIGNSLLSESGTAVTVGGTLAVTGASTVTLGSGSGNTGSLLFKNSSNNNTLTLQSGATGSNLSFTLPTADGTNAQCLKTNASGVLSFGDCLSGAGGGGGGVTSLNGLSGVLSLANASGSGATITIDNASTSAKGIAQFNATNFTASSGTINTIQDIATTSSPTFATLTANTELRILEDGGSPTNYGTLNVTTLPSDQTYTLNEGGTVITTGNIASNATTGVTAGTGLTGGGTIGVLTVNVGAGDGITVNPNDITLNLQANKGLEVDGSGLSLIDCTNNGEILKYSTGTNTWTCQADAGGTGVGDSIQVNGSDAADANFFDVAATGTITGTAWSLNTATTPDQLTVAISNASATTAGSVTTGAQTLAGAKTFNALVTAGAGIDLGTQTLSGTGAVINFDFFDVASSGAVTAVGVNSGSGLLQGTGGITIIGAANVNATGAAATNLGTGTGAVSLGNSTGTLTVTGNSSSTFVVSGVTVDATEFNVLDGGLSETDISGEIEAVMAGNGLTGGGASGPVTLDVAGGNGITANADSIEVDATTTGTTATTSSNSGLEATATGLRLLGGCSGSNVFLKWNTSTSVWECAADNDSGGSITLQSAYNNSTTPEIVLDGVRGALTVRDNPTPLGANLLEVQSNDGLTTYLAVTSAGTNVTGTGVFSGNINTSGGAVQTNSVSRIDNTGNLINIGNITGTASMTMQATAGTLALSATGANIITGSTNGTQRIQIDSTGFVVATNHALTVIGGSTANRPAGTTEGQIFYDQTLDQMLIYSNGKWQADRTTATKIVAASNSLNKEKADYLADGTADQTEINAALSALPPAGGVVYLLEGTYTTTASITLGTNKTLAGSGESTLIQLDSSVGTSIDAISGSGINNVTLTGFKLDGNKAGIGAGAQDGIDMNNVGSLSGANAVTGFRINKVTVQNFEGKGINVTSGNPTNSTISDSIIRANVGRGIDIASENLTISQNVIQGNSTGVGITDQNNTITNNLVEGHTDVGIDSASDNTVISANKLKSNGDGGSNDANIVSSGNKASITGNIAEGGNPSGILAAVGNYSTISGNTIFGSTVRGIYVISSNNTITANTSYLNGDDGIYAAFTASQNTISGNTVYTNTGDGIEIGGSNNTVSGNSINNNTGRGISVASTSSVINSNNLTSNAGTGGSTTDHIFVSQLADNNQIVGNKITDTSGSGCAFNFGAAPFAPANTYLADNTYSGTGAATICNVPASTIQAGQLNGSNQFVIQGTANVVLGEDIAINGGDITSSSGTFNLVSSGVTTLNVADAANTINLAGGSGSTGCTLDGTTGNLTCSGTITGGTALTLQNVYTNDANGSDAIIGLTSTDGGILVRDASTPIGSTLFAVQSDAGTSTFLSVDASAISLGVNTTVAAGKSLTLTGGNTASRPASPTEGMMYYDTTTKQLLVYANAKWQADRTTATKIVAMGAPAGCIGVAVPVASQNYEKADYVVNSCTSAQTTINTAITALGAQGGIVYLLEGTYIYDGATSMNNNVTLSGSGAGTVLKLKDNSASSIDAISASTKNRMTITNLRLDGNKANNTNSSQGGINCNTCGSGTGSSAIPGVKINHVWVENYRGAAIYLNVTDNSSVTGSTLLANLTHGIHMTNTSDYNVIANNNIQGNDGNGIQVDGTNNTISSNNVQGNGAASGITVGIDIGGDNNQITGNTVAGNFATTYGALRVSGSGTTVTGNQVVGNTGPGVHIGDDNNTITGNTISNNSDNGIEIGAGRNNIISANSLVANTGDGIHVPNGSTSYNTISGNSFRSNTSNGIELWGTNNNYSISGNRIDASGSSGIVLSNFAGTVDAVSITNNVISNTAGTGYAIHIESGTTNTYLSDNRYSGTGASSIFDAGTGTIYTGQTNQNDNILLQGSTGTEVAGFLNTGYGGIGKFGNLLLYSEGFDDATSSTTWAETSMTVTADAASAPDGQTTAELLNSGGSSSTRQDTTQAVGGDYTFSVWLKSNSTSASRNVNLRIDGSTGGTGTAKAVIATPNWQRYYVTQNTASCPVACTGNVRAVLALPTSSDDVHAWGAQLMSGTSPGVYTRTVSTATSLSRGMASNGGLYVSASSATDKPLVVQAAASQTANLFEIQNSAGSVLANFAADGALTTAGDAAINGGDLTSTAGTFNLINNTAATNINMGGALTTGTITVGGTAQTGTLTVGQSTASNTINVGNATIATGNTGTINIGTNATGTGKTATTIGSTNDASSVAIRAGTGNINLTPSGTSNTGVVIKPVADSTAAFRIQNAAGTNMLAVDTVYDSTNLITNGGFETNSTGWNTRAGTANVGRVTTQKYHGDASLQFDANAIGEGVNYPVSLSNGTTYAAAIYVKNTTSTDNLALVFGYSQDGTTETLVSGSVGTSTAGWTRHSINFTTTTVSGSPYFFVKTTGATARSFFLDGASISTAAHGGAYEEGTLNLSGVISASLNLQNSEDSTNALTVYRNSGARLFAVDTLNGNVRVGDTAINTGRLSVYNNISSTVGLYVQNDSTSDIVQFNDGNSNTVFKIADEGSATFQNKTDSTTAFQIQNSAGASNLFVADTTNTRIGIGTAAPSETLEVVGTIVSRGTSWTSRTAAQNNFWQATTYGNGLFVAVSSDGTNRVMTSPDGINWTARTSAAANNWTGVTYGNGLFVAVSCSVSSDSCNATAGNRVMTSPDGINWTLRADAADNQWLSVAYGNGLFVAVSENGSTNRVMTSPDGINWTSRTTVNSSWGSVTYGNGRFVAVAYNGTDRVMTSTDGITWATASAAAVNGWTSVTYGNGLFVAVANSGTGNRVMTSPDATNWTIRTSAADNNWFGATYGNGLFVAVSASGAGNRVMTSPNGINWVTRASASDSFWTNVTYGNGVFVAPTSGSVMTSGKTEINELSTNNTYQGGMTVYGDALYKSNANSTTAFQVQDATGEEIFNVDTTNRNVGISSLGAEATTKLVVRSETKDVLKLIAVGTADNSANDLLELQYNSTNVLKITNTGKTSFQNQTNSNNAFQVQNASAEQLFNVDTTSPNLITNSSLETDTSGWTAKAGTTIARSTTEKFIGNASLAITADAAGEGAKYDYTFTNGTTYYVTFEAKLASGTMTTLDIGRADDGSTETTCATGRAIYTSGWTRITCSFMAGAQSGTPYFFIKQSDATSRTFYVDAFQVTTGSNMNYQDGQLSLNGIITSPTIFKNQSDSGRGFTVQDASGLDLLSVNTKFGRVEVNAVANPLDAGASGLATLAVNSWFTNTQYDEARIIFGENAASASNNPSGAGVLKYNGGTNGGLSNKIHLGAFDTSTNGSTYRDVLTYTTNGENVTLQNNFGQNNTNLYILNNATSSIILKPGGAGQDNASAIQVQNGSGNALINVDTSGSAITLHGGVTGGTLTTDIAGTLTSNAVCHSGGAGANANVQIVACTGAIVADYAESYPVAAGSSYGDIVAIGSNMINTYGGDAEGNVNFANPKGQITQLVKSSSSYQINTVGIISDNYHNFTSAGRNIKPEDNPMPVALSGRVPVNISSTSAPIQPGDYITTSTDPGKGMKATGAGYVIGKALATWSPGGTTVMVFVEPGYYPGPDMGNFIQNGGSATLSGLTVSGTANFSAVNVSGTTTLEELNVTGTATLASLVVAGDATFQGDILVNGHIVTGGLVPTVQAQASAGVGATVAIEGNDTAGTITVTTGSSPTAGSLVKIIFAKKYAAKPRVVLSPSNNAASDLRYFKDAATAGDFTLSATAAPSPNVKYEYDYFIAQ